jgi:hypothetical protein
MSNFYATVEDLKEIVEYVEKRKIPPQKLSLSYYGTELGYEISIRYEYGNTSTTERVVSRKYR